MLGTITSHGLIWPPTHAARRKQYQEQYDQYRVPVYPTRLLWPQVVLNSVATSSHYEDGLIKVHQFPPTQCKLYLYWRCLGLFLIEFHDIVLQENSNIGDVGF